MRPVDHAPLLMRVWRCLTFCVTLALPAWPAANTVVILGSSTAAGTGATSYNKAWAGRLTSSLQARQIPVKNVSIAGDNTERTIARFARDVSPQNPAYVVLATSIYNENFVAAPVEAYNNYLTNIRRLIGMVRDIGAVPVVIGQYPNSAYTARHKELIRSLYGELDDIGVQTWDFWDATSDSKGDWPAGMSVDGTHPGDAGHELMFESIPLTFFDAGRAPLQTSTTKAGAWTYVGDFRTPDPMLVQLDRTAGSWTQMLSVSAWPLREAALMSNDAGVAVVQSDGEYRLIDSDGRTLVQYAPSPYDGRPHHVAMTYQRAFRLLALYGDGVLLGSKEVALADASKFVFAGAPGDPALGCVGCTVENPAVFRSALRGADLEWIARGRLMWKSLEAWMPLDHDPGSTARNVANTTNTAVLNGLWAVYIEPDDNSKSLCRLACRSDEGPVDPPRLP